MKEKFDGSMLKPVSFGKSHWLAILIMCNWHWFKSDGGCLLINWDTLIQHHKSSVVLSNVILAFNGTVNLMYTHCWGLGLLLYCKITCVLITTFMESTIIKTKVFNGNVYFYYLQLIDRSFNNLTWEINSLFPERYGSNFECVILQQTHMIDIFNIFCEISLRWIQKDFTDDKSPLV